MCLGALKFQVYIILVAKRQQHQVPLPSWQIKWDEMETSISLNQYIISVMRSASCLSCVVGIAVEAFLRYKMEPDIRGFSTIIAQDPNHFVLIWLRHWCSGNLHVQFLPNLWHITDRLWTERACELEMFSHFIQTAFMDCMSARHNNDIISWFKQILKTNRAIMMHCSFHTGVTVSQQSWVATTTLITMEEILLSASSANSTAITMVLLLRYIIVVELACITKVLAHANTTINAILLCLLFSTTKWTYHLFDLVSRHVVSMLIIYVDIIFCLIVTMAAIKNLIATGGPDSASSPVVLASMFHISLLLQIICTWFFSRQGFRIWFWRINAFFGHMFLVIAFKLQRLRMQHCHLAHDTSYPQIRLSTRSRNRQ